MKNTFKQIIRYRHAKLKKYNLLRAIDRKDLKGFITAFEQEEFVNKKYPPFGRNVLHLAIRNNLPDITKYLLSYVRKYNIRLDLDKDHFGYTAYQLSAKCDQKNFEQIMIDHFSQIRESKIAPVKYGGKSLITAKASPSFFR